MKRLLCILTLTLCAACEPDPQSNPGSEKEAAAVKAGGVIPGLKPADVHLKCEEQGFLTMKRPGTAKHEWKCILSEKGADLTVVVTGPEATKVSAVSATVINIAVEPDSTRAKTMLSWLASLPYTGAEPEKAREWVANNIDTDDAKSTFGGVTFQITAKHRTRILRMTMP